MKEYTVKVYGDRTEWLHNGKHHREDGPAVEYSNGSKVWFVNGRRHREDGPAVEYMNGLKVWWVNGKRHREDGPAVERGDGSKNWWVDGVELTEKEFNNRHSPVELTLDQIAEQFGVDVARVRIIK